MADTERERLHDLANVIGSYVDASTGELVVQVTEKKPEDALDPVDRVPATVDGRPTRVEQTGPTDPMLDPADFPADGGYPDRRTTWDRYAAGISVTDGEGSGTASPPVRRVEDDVVGLVSNRHVAPERGATIRQGSPDAPPIATVDDVAPEDSASDSGFWPIEMVGTSIEDYWTDEVLGIGRFGGFRRPDPDVSVYKKSGARSGVTSAVLLSTDATLDVDGTPYHGLHLFSAIGMAGDSGSLIGYVEDDRFYATSLLFRGSINRTWAIPLSRVMDVHGELEPVAIPHPVDEEPDFEPEPEPTPEPEDPKDDDSPSRNAASGSWVNALWRAIERALRPR